MGMIDYRSAGGDLNSFAGQFVVTNVDDMPVNGWVSSYFLNYRALVNNDSGFREFLYVNDELADSTPAKNVTDTYLYRGSSAVSHKTSAGANLKWGVYTGGSASSGAIASGTDTTNYSIRYKDIGGALPQSWPNTGVSSFDFKMKGYLEYVQQVAPTAGSFQSPTPAQNAQEADQTPTIRGTLPHAGGDGDHDETEKVQLRIINANTGATIYDQEITPTTAEKDGNYFERTPVTLAPGTQVEVDFRHQDTWNAWSPWSAKRTFTVLDANPGQGAWSSPTPAANSLVTTSTPTLAGTTPHPNGDGAYDYSTTVQLLLTNEATGATILDTQYTTTSSERSSSTWSRTVPAISQGTTVIAQFRHRDRGGTWSSYSAIRRFTISSGPDKPVISRPKGKVNFVNEAGYQAGGGSGAMYAGSYNNSTGAAMHSVRVQIYSADETTKLVDTMWVARTATSGVWTLPQASFPSSGSDVIAHPASLEWGTIYKVRAAVAEDSSGSKGIESAWGDFVTLTTNSFPDRPEGLSPADGVSTASLQFTAGVSDPDGDAITHGAMKITRVSNNQAVVVPNRANLASYPLGEDRSQTSWSSRARAENAGRTVDSANAPTFSSAIPNEGNTVKEIPATAIARSTAYTVGQCRLRPGQTTADTWFMEVSAITTGTTSGTNPGYTSPVNGNTVVDGGVTWTYRIPITWRNAGPSNEWSMDVTGNSLSRTLDPSRLTLGQEYSWMARARDAGGWGQFSTPEPFLYASVPEIYQFAPQINKRTNLIEDPSAEYPPAATPYWTWTGLDASNTVERTNEDAAHGDQSWKATLAASGAAKGTGKKHTIDPTKPVFVYGMFKKLSGTTTLRFRLLCYNSGGTLLGSGTLYPTTVLTGNGANVPTSWTEYGGIVWPIGSGNSPAMPTNTTQVAVEIMPSEGTAATVYFDAIMLEQGLIGWTSGQWAQAQKWHGYFDGDTQSHDTETRTYSWSGTTGLSASQGDPVLRETQPNLYFWVIHTANVTARRLLVDRWIDRLQEWRQIHDTGFVNDTITSNSMGTFPLPLAVVKNEGRYRARVQGRDALGISGEGSPAAFDTFYVGPAEPAITSVEANASEATVSLSWTASTLTSGEFGGYEVARQAPGEREVVLYREMNQSATSFTDPYPLSGVDYLYKVRVVRVVALDLLQGRWARTQANVDYSGIWFVKDTESPLELYSAYETSIESMPTPEEDAISAVSYPWGSDRPRVSTRRSMRIRTGQVVAQFYPDNQIVESHEQRYDKMRRIANRRNTICILTHEPDTERVFASIIGPYQKGLVGIRVRSLTFAYQENSYEEDIRDREGD